MLKLTRVAYNGFAILVDRKRCVRVDNRNEGHH